MPSSQQFEVSPQQPFIALMLSMIEARELSVVAWYSVAMHKWHYVVFWHAPGEAEAEVPPSGKQNCRLDVQKESQNMPRINNHYAIRIIVLSIMNETQCMDQQTNFSAN